MYHRRSGPRRLSAAVAAGLAATLCGTQPGSAAETPTPPELAHCRLPADYRLEGRGDDKLVGLYWGRWAETVSHTLVIDKVTRDGIASGYYAWGPAGRQTAGCERFEGRVRGEALEIRLRNDAIATYRPRHAGATLWGQWAAGDGRRMAAGDFQRIAGPGWRRGAATAMRFIDVMPTSAEGRLCPPAVIAIPADLPEERRAFLGVFEGQWAFRGAIDHTLIVTSMGTSGLVRGYYAHGKFAGWGVDEAGCRPFTGRIEDEELVLEPHRTTRITYWPTDDGLAGRYDWGGDASSAFPRYIGGEFERTQ